ncbi:glycine-rich protein A3-like isoform X2 [Phoenix dactylifera]|uniref:Glycine-rich protein A3-like isoform X2 n=1 Tax=Phoenix dactylifera TaxID=42345 RepID=A0A8B7C8B0_PHODC|nr:glycine-rich protein A3-like isoform X2 [Phoenix dactylifera]
MPRVQLHVGPADYPEMEAYDTLRDVHCFRSHSRRSTSRSDLSSFLKMGGGKDKHDEKGFFSDLAHGHYPPGHHSGYPPPPGAYPPQGYPPAPGGYPQGYPPQGYPPAGYSGPSAPHQGHGSHMGAMLAGGAAAAAAAYGAHHMSHGSHHAPQGAYYGHTPGHHGKFKHGKFGKHKHGKHGMIGGKKGMFGGKFKKWK